MARGSRRVRRAGAAVTRLLLGGWILRQAGGSMLFHRYSQWERATAAMDAYLGALGEQIRGSRDGEVVEARPPPIWLPADPAPMGPRLVPALAPYLVRGWAAVVFPDRKIDFVGPSSGSEEETISEGLVIHFRDAAGDGDGG